MVTFIAQINDQGKVDFLTDYNRARFKDWCKENTGAKIKIKPVSHTVSEKRRAWYWGAIIPFMKELHSVWDNYTDEQVHELIKLEFNGYDLIGIDGSKRRVGLGVVNSRSEVENFDNFILRLDNYVNENFGMSLPDPELFKRERDEGEPIEGKIDYPENDLQPKF